MKLLTGIASILIILILIALSCNNPVEEINNNNGGNGHNDSCGFGILTVVNNTWNNIQVLVDSTLIFTVKFKSSNGGPVPLGLHNFKVGIPQNYIIDTVFYIDDCLTYTLYCQQEYDKYDNCSYFFTIRFFLFSIIIYFNISPNL